MTSPDRPEKQKKHDRIRRRPQPRCWQGAPANAARAVRRRRSAVARQPPSPSARVFRRPARRRRPAPEQRPFGRRRSRPSRLRRTATSRRRRCSTRRSSPAVTALPRRARLECGSAGSHAIRRSADCRRRAWLQAPPATGFVGQGRRSALRRMRRAAGRSPSRRRQSARPRSVRKEWALESPSGCVATAVPARTPPNSVPGQLRITRFRCPTDGQL